jgi:guanylate kinase
MLIALSGPSGIGKGFIKDRLMESCPGLMEIPWLTTRSPRSGERISGNRIFVSEEHFNNLDRAGDIALAHGLYGSRYGVERKHLVHQQTKRLTEIHPENVSSALQIVPDVILIGLITADYLLLKGRVASRDADGSVIPARLEAACAEMALIESQRTLFWNVYEISQDSATTEQIVRDIQSLVR